MGELSTSTENKWLQIMPNLGVSMMDHLFSRLDAMYPQKWRLAFRTDAEVTNWRVVWSSSFEHHKITLKDVKNGLDNLATSEADWIPTLGQFITSCKTYQNQACHQKHAALPKPNYPKEKALENLAKMKAMIAGSRIGGAA